MVLKQIKDLKRDEKRSFHQLISFFIPAKRFYDAVHKAKEAGRAGNKSVEKEQIVVAHKYLPFLLKNNYPHNEDRDDIIKSQRYLNI